MEINKENIKMLDERALKWYRKHITQFHQECLEFDRSYGGDPEKIFHEHFKELEKLLTEEIEKRNSDKNFLVPTKAIMLDVDGVINTTGNQLQANKEHKRFWTMGFDASCLRYLKKLVEETGAKIILSSSWRLPDADNSYKSYEHLEKCLSEYGLTIEGKTPGDGTQNREDEILEWLGEHPEVTNYVILDDDLYINQCKEVSAHFVYCQCADGLTKKKYLKAKEILERE